MTEFKSSFASLKPGSYTKLGTLSDAKAATSAETPSPDAATPAPKLNPETPAPKRATIPDHVRRQVWEKAQGKCSYQDPETGRSCNSKHQLEVDHIQPIALQGSNDPSNLRLLCKHHNLQAAIHSFGGEVMAAYLKR